MSTGTSEIADRKRQELLQKMPPPLRKIATDLEGRRNRKASSDVLYLYDVGARLATVVNAEAVYGSRALEQLGAYLGLDHGARYMRDLIAFSQAYTRDDVVSQMGSPMNNGQPLTAGHLMLLMRTASVTKRTAWLKRVRVECLSIEALRNALDASGPRPGSNGPGRPVTVPASPLAGLQRTRVIIQKSANWMEAFDKDVVPKLEGEEASEPLLRNLQEAEDQIERVVAQGQATLARLRAISKKLEAASPGGDADADESDEPPDVGDDFEELDAPRPPGKTHRPPKSPARRGR